ncbi:fimbrial biogenesis outer membrane usher protein [Brevundimonas sp. Root1423]|uniref:fimbrial biogenesis outer membrane usher protein n=1 Tax=Brevundimonas sp. Root1423 TaxID=1736462 RepID=UPI0007017EA2|nr:fimbrial biogenesis outer membrane usher protein [Brevundimonas sp. Root1423]KQY75381.1 pilus assembly protein PapC [Brevundimonas sp. Root1423]
MAQAGVIPQTPPRSITIGEADPQTVQLNATGRDVTLTVPAKDGPLYLGDLILNISARDEISFATDRTLDLLANILAPVQLETLRASFAGRASITPADLERVGISAVYNPQVLELVFQIPSEFRAAQGVSIANLDRNTVGDFATPAGFSAYLNARTNLEYIHEGVNDGFVDPLLFLDFAARMGGVVLESQGIWSPGGAQTEFQRQDTRLVWDDTVNLVRWSAGDLRPVVRGYQGSPNVAGLSLLRTYSQLQPQLVSRPRGARSFSLERPSTVEVYINGQIVRRLQLNPGNYDLSDFPFIQGANDVRLAITDDAGRTEVVRFNVFFDQTQLAQGLSEFGFYAGVKSSLDVSGPDYSDDLIATGFYRAGVSDSLTLGANFQLDERSGMLGGEAVIGTSLGTVGLQFGVSDSDYADLGTAATVTFQRVIQRENGQADAFNMFFEHRSESFAAAGVLPNNPFEYETGAAYTHAFSDEVYAGFDVRFSKGRDILPSYTTARGTVGWRLTPSTSLTTDIIYEDGPTGSSMSGLVSLNVRFGQFSSGRAEYDTRDNRARVGVQTIRGQGVNAFSGAFDMERSDSGSGLNASGNWIGNRAEVGFSHFGAYEDMFGSALDERSSLRLGAALAIADGAVSVGRPITDAFALVRPHKSLKGASVILEPTPDSYLAETGRFGSAIAPNLPAYSEQTITIDAPEAPMGADLGQGSFRVFPPYRGGYLLEVGSAYNISAVGSLLDETGAPLSLVSGVLTELGATAESEPTVIFTNRVGRFSLVGLRPGRWQLQMTGENPATYLIDVPEDADGVLRLEGLRPVAGE